MPSIKAIGGESQLRLVANWLDREVAPSAQINPVDQLDKLLPLVDLLSITETTMWNFMCENHVIITNQECRLFPPTFLVSSEHQLRLIYFYFSNRQRLINARAYANFGLLLVEVKNGEAILRSATELQSTGALRMPIPYRECCGNTFANGKYFTTATFGWHAVMPVGLTSWR